MLLNKTDARLTTVVSPFSHFMKFCGITHDAKIGTFFERSKHFIQKISFFKDFLQMEIFLHLFEAYLLVFYALSAPSIYSVQCAIFA